MKTWGGEKTYLLANDRCQQRDYSSITIRRKRIECILQTTQDNSVSESGRCRDSGIKVIDRKDVLARLDRRTAG